MAVPLCLEWRTGVSAYQSHTPPPTPAAVNASCPPLVLHKRPSYIPSDRPVFLHVSTGEPLVICAVDTAPSTSNCTREGGGLEQVYTSGCLPSGLGCLQTAAVLPPNAQLAANQLATLCGHAGQQVWPCSANLFVPWHALAWKTTEGRSLRV